MPSGPRVATRLLVEILVIGFFVLVGWTGYTVLGVLDTDHLVSLPAISVAWVQSVVPISAALIIVAELLNLPRALADAGNDGGITGGGLTLMPIPVLASTTAPRPSREVAVGTIAAVRAHCSRVGSSASRQAAPGRGSWWGGRRCAPTALRCSAQGRAAELAALAALAALKQARRVR